MTDFFLFMEYDSYMWIETAIEVTIYLNWYM